MEVLIFKTNIRYRKHIQAIEPFIASHPGILRWNVDLKDADKILRIETRELHPSTIEGLLKSAGYSCEELND
jgi:hypothetical protein